METKHRKGDFLVLSASREIEFPNPVEVFAKNPYAYTGTPWKLKNIGGTWQTIINSNSWKNAAHNLIPPSNFVPPEQIAVPADEPDHLLQQEDLVFGKTKNQIEVLMRTLGSPSAEDGSVNIPDSILEMYAQGYLSIAFINSDVGNMHRIGAGKFYPLRNFYAQEKLLLRENESKLSKRLRGYWRDTYPERPGSYTRVIESGATLTQIVWQRDSGKAYSRIFPGVSTVGLLVEKSILSEEKGRQAAVEFLHNKYSSSADMWKKDLNPLSSLNGRAGGMKSEDYFELARALGTYVELITQGETLDAQMNSLMEHVEGPPLPLLQQLFLTLLTTPNCELHNIAGSKSSGPRVYPRGKRSLLTI